MSLRDEMLEERRKQKEREQHKKTVSKTSAAQNGADEDRYGLQFDALKRDVQSGKIPAEWKNRYDALIQKIKQALGDSKEEFSVTETVTQAYYEEQARLRRGKESAVTLFNDYMTAQLKNEGFRNVVFALRDKVETYSTEDDYGAYKLEESRYSSEMGFYHYERDYLDPDAWDTPKPTAPTLGSSGKRHVYEIYAAGTLYQFKQERKNRILRLSGFSRFLPIILGILCAVAAMVYFSIVGHFFGINFPVLAVPYYAVLGVGIAFAVRGVEWFARRIHYGRLDDRLSAKERRTIIGSALLRIVALIVAIGGLSVVAALPFIL